MIGRDKQSMQLNSIFTEYKFGESLSVVSVSVYDKRGEPKTITMLEHVWRSYCAPKTSQLGGEDNIFISLDGIKYGKQAWRSVMRMMYTPTLKWEPFKHYVDTFAAPAASGPTSACKYTHMMLAITRWLDMNIPAERLNQSMRSYITATRETLNDYLRMYIHLVVPPRGPHDFGDDLVLSSRACYTAKNATYERDVIVRPAEFNTSAHEIAERAGSSLDIITVAHGAAYLRGGVANNCAPEYLAQRLIRYARLELIYFRGHMLQISPAVSFETAAEILRLSPQLADRRWMPEFISVLTHGIGALTVAD